MANCRSCGKEIRRGSYCSARACHLVYRRLWWKADKIAKDGSPDYTCMSCGEYKEARNRNRIPVCDDHPACRRQYRRVQRLMERLKGNER